MRFDERHDADGVLSFCVLASGSKGNSIYISSATTHILVDAGLSAREIERRLRSKRLSPDQLDGIILSHEHADHIQGVGVLSRRFGLPVYISRNLTAAVDSLGKLSDLHTFECGSTFEIQDLTIHPFSVSHDAEDPAGFTIAHNDKAIGIATDLGMATSMVKQHLKCCNALILEANHDPVLLAGGPYPWPLKQRIRSRTGHLSNAESRDLLKEIQHKRLQHVILAHLSETNNSPQKAYDAVSEALAHRQIQLAVARQDLCGELVELI
jgi:phosphoribosyl 1,2-cyclic phosphodiesterase